MRILPGPQYAHRMLTLSQNPIKAIKKNGFIALLLVTVLYILANVAYFAAGECLL